MGINLSNLEKVKHLPSKIIARCPACAETGNDRKGEHLFIGPDGRFGCVVFPGVEGRTHRKKIFELAGIRENIENEFKVKKSLPLNDSGEKAIQKNILGRLGHLDLTPARKVIQHSLPKNEKQNKCLISVPNVPKSSQHLYSQKELNMLQGLDGRFLKKIDLAKRLFKGRIVSVMKKPNDLGKSTGDTSYG